MAASVWCSPRGQGALAVAQTKGGRLRASTIRPRAPSGCSSWRRVRGWCCSGLQSASSSCGGPRNSLAGCSCSSAGSAALGSSQPPRASAQWRYWQPRPGSQGPGCRRLYLSSWSVASVRSSPTLAMGPWWRRRRRARPTGPPCGSSWPSVSGTASVGEDGSLWSGPTGCALQRRWEPATPVAARGSPSECRALTSHASTF
mmetsp:Transcript_28579/g.91098  ORF Transcript_28579/g.91098 Transcript_28579/m.91098 type:complete len:201 (-) Transcript_28579:760-1362(-)